MAKYKSVAHPSHSVLEMLGVARIFLVKNKTANNVEFVDGCDECFGLVMRKEQLIALADEITELSNTLKD